MTETTTYTWSAFELNSALSGLLVGFRQEADYDLSRTGRLTIDMTSSYGQYRTIIDGKMMWCGTNGVIAACPSNPAYVGRQLMMVQSHIMLTQGVTLPTRGGADTTVNIASMEPRDQFAAWALMGLLRQVNRPEELDDAAILQLSATAYRLAQGMLIEAANARKVSTPSSGDGSGSSGGSTSRSDVDTSDGTVTEKLLGNLVLALDDLTKQMKTNNSQLKEQVTAIADRLGDTLHIDNPEDDKFEIEGSGLGSLSDADVAALYAALKDKIAAEFDAKGAAAQALADAKAYTDSKTS